MLTEFFRRSLRGFGDHEERVKILLANVLQRILHQVLLITRIKIYRYCSTINFTEYYFRQQYQ